MAYNILIVDDEQAILRALERTLFEGNYIVTTASSSSEAISLCKSAKFDLILTDYAMPGMNGIDLLVEVSKTMPDAVMMLMSGKGDLNMAIDAINKAVVYKFIVKPWDDDELLKIIDRSLDRYRLVMENSEMKMKIKKMMNVFERLEDEAPGITQLKRNEDGAIIID